MVHIPDFSNRDWQVQGLTNWDAFVDKQREDNSFFVMACPGAGKTRFAIAAIDAALKKKAVDLVVVVAPSEKIRDQWEKDAKEFIGFDLHHPTSRDLKDAMLDDEIGMAGIGVTYQKMAINAEVFEQWSRDLRVMVIFDEVHHLCDERSWGNAAEIGFNNAELRLILSGTPFRTSANERIPFIMEMGSSGNEKVREPDAKYTYGEAAQDRVCRTAYFHRINAQICFEDNDGMWRHYLNDEDIAPDVARRVYRAALDGLKTDYSRYLLEKANIHLNKIRKEEQDDAAMLVIAQDQNTARTLQTIIHAMTGKEPPLVISDDPASQNTITRFKKKKTPILVSVKMVGEGVDIPRVRIVAFLSRELTEMWFRQVVGRAVRWQAHLNGAQNAHIYIPQIPILEEMAMRIEEEVQHIYENRVGGGGVEGGTGGGGIPSFFMSHGSTDHKREGYIGIGEEFTEIDAKEAEEIAQSDPLMKRFGSEVVAVLMRALQKHKADPIRDRYDINETNE